MSATLTAVREKYPAYADVPDDKLAKAIGDKYPQYLQQDHQFFAEYNAAKNATLPTPGTAGQVFQALTRGSFKQELKDIQAPLPGIKPIEPVEIKPTDSTAAAVGKESYNLAIGIPNFIATPAGAATALTGGASGTATKIAASLFSAQAWQNAGNAILNLIPNWHSLSKPEKAKALTDVGGNALFGTLLAKGAAPKTVAEQIAPQTTEALKQTVAETPKAKVEPAKTEAKTVAEPAKPAAEPEKIIAAAVKDASGTPQYGFNHPEIENRLGMPQTKPEQRNTPQYGFRTDQRDFITREEAGPVATASGQNLKEFEPDEPVHSDEVASPTQPEKPLSETAPPVAPTEPTPAKEPWQMTKDEYKKAVKERHGPKGQEDVTFLGLDDESVGKAMRWFSEAKRLLGKRTGQEILADPWGHRVIIENALKEGKPVPPEVLADYPDLISERAKETAPAAGTPTDTPKVGEPAAAGEAKLKPVEQSASLEAAAINDWLKKYPATRGKIPAKTPYLPSRERAFVRAFNQKEPEAIGTQLSQLVPKMEDARHAIEIGQRLGYRPEDISAYLLRNYVQKYSAEAFRDLEKAGEQPTPPAPAATSDVGPGMGAAKYGETKPGDTPMTKQDLFALKIAASSKRKTAPAIEPPTVNEETGGAKPPPPDSVFSPDTSPNENPHKAWANRLMDSFTRWWEKFWPRSYAVTLVAPDSPVITEHQALIKADVEYLRHFADQKWWKALQKYDEQDLINLEDKAVKSYRANLEAGDEPMVAYRKALDSMPDDFKALLQQRDARLAAEIKAADILNVDRPAMVDDPYVARLTNEDGKDIVDLHPAIGSWGRQIRTSIGSFEKSRTHPTMKEGIAAGTQYDPVLSAVWRRELFSIRLEATAKMLQNLKDKGVLFDTEKEALAASPTGKTAKVRGFGGKDYYARTREEAIFLEQNLNTARGGALGKIRQLADTYVRNPSLINPLPHVTKNMLFKYMLARVGNFRFKADTREFLSATPSELRTRFEKVMPFPETGERIPQLTAREVGTWGEKLSNRGLRLNTWSNKFIFAQADPAMRYSLWKSYVRKGMGDQEAANHVWLDLIRYDENSGGMTFWKSIPMNFFSTWRTGSIVTLAKQFKSHPIRALLFIGAVEYLREIRYRKTGRWTHIPTDYVDAPLAEAIEKHSLAGTGALVATTAIFGPGGGQAPNNITDLMAAFHGDPQGKSRLQNMFWGISQLYNIPREYEAYRKDGKDSHLVNILTSAALAEHSALKYQPRRLMQWLPEWMPGLEKSKLVKQAEALQKKVETKQQKGQATYERRHGVAATFERSPEEQQLEELKRSAGHK